MKDKYIALFRGINVGGSVLLMAGLFWQNLKYKWSLKDKTSEVFHSVPWG